MEIKELTDHLMYLKRGGASKEYSTSILPTIIGSNGKLGEDEATALVENIYLQNPDQAMSTRIAEYINSVTGHDISVTFCDKELEIVTLRDRANRRQVFKRLVERGIIEATSKEGWYKKVNLTLDEMDLENADPYNTVNIDLPFGLHNWFKIFPKNIICLVGDTDAGKSAFAINILRLNQNSKYPFRIFNSENGPEEMRLKLEDAHIPLKRYKIYERDSDFASALHPDGINVIDYYELAKDFHLVGEEFMKATLRLRKGIAIYILQKKFGAEMGVGAEFTIRKPRVYLSMSYDRATKIGKLVVLKAKVPKIRGVAIKGWEWEYKLDYGVDFTITKEPEGVGMNTEYTDIEINKR
jgi:hypothetical protein